ncbi:MAG TPA: ATP-binding protein [Vicinamibacterales bacterium]|nr:ATP-binding protein [Vicinamibacterales bacterium]
MSDPLLRLLIVEDDEDLSRVIAAAAAARGMTVEAVSTPAGARAVLERGGCDVALVDLVLGGESGFDLLRAIGQEWPDTSIVVMSGNSSIGSAIQSYEMAAFAYVQKPFDLDELLLTVERAAEHRRITLNNRRMLWELQTITDIADGIAHSLELDDVLKGALARMCEALDVPNAAVRLKDETSGAFEVAAFVGPPAVRRMWSPYGGPLPRPSDAVIATGRPVVIEDVASLVGREIAETLPVRSAVSVPMIVADELIGTMTLSYTKPRRFTAADERLLLTIAGQIGGAVQSARLHAAVRRAKREWEETFDAIGEPIAVYDSGGRLMRGNAALARELGCSVRELPGQSCDGIGFCGAAFPACAVGLAVGEVRRDEITRPDGQIFSVTTFPLRSDGDGAVVQVAKNVTQEIVGARRMRALSEELADANRRSMAALIQLKSTQAQLLQAEKLSAIGQLVAGVAHELNNPLTSVIGYAQLLEEEVRSASVAALDVDALRQDLGRIAEESERAARIVRNLLAFARRQSAARALQDVGELFDRTLALREYALRSSGVELTRAFAPSLPPVFADGNQIQQALLNLVLNAEHAMRGRDVRRLAVGAAYDDAACAVELFVRDTGHGIEAANIGRIFDPFFTTRDVGEGTGLGLSICYGIVRDHGGQIVVDSRPGEGATFRLLLPARSNGAGGRDPLLVAHGDGGDHDTVATALDAWGWSVRIVSSSAAALDQYRSSRFSGLFIETRLIRGDLAAWRAARGGDPLRTPLVLMGLDDDPDVEQFGLEQASAVLAAPFSLRSLRSAVRAVSEECV